MASAFPSIRHLSDQLLRALFQNKGTDYSSPLLSKQESARYAGNQLALMEPPSSLFVEEYRAILAGKGNLRQTLHAERQ